MLQSMRSQRIRATEVIIRLLDICFSKQGMEVSLFKWKTPGLGEGRGAATPILV